MKTIATACTLVGFTTLIGSGVPAQPRHTHHPLAMDRAQPRVAARPAPTAQTVQAEAPVEVTERSSPLLARSPAPSPEARAARISTTAENQILLELAPEDTTPPNLFDLHERTLVFTPDGHGGYSRGVGRVAWEETIGSPVADGQVVPLRSFNFHFAGRTWDSFFVSRRGLITFGEPLRYSEFPAENRNAPMWEVFSKFVTAPTISPLYKPTLGGFHTDTSRGGTQHVFDAVDRVVVTWIATDPVRWVHGVPVGPSRFQVVLYADGSVMFNYKDDAFFGDGIVGLFPDEPPTKGDLIASIPDTTDASVPGYLDLQEMALYEAGNDGVIVEFTTRDPIPVADVADGDTVYSYRLYFDTDRPWWPGPGSERADFAWAIDVHASGERRAWGPGVRALDGDAGNRIALVASIREIQGIAAAVYPVAAEFRNDIFVAQDLVLPPTQIELPVMASADLSQADRRYSRNHSEVFHHRSAPDFDEIACRVIDTFGDVFDVMVFHYEYLVDSSGAGLRGIRQPSNLNVGGIGRSYAGYSPCGSERIKSGFPIWVGASNFFYAPSSRSGDPTVFRNALVTFAHEMTHAWTAYASYNRNGEIAPLFYNDCECHWLAELHTPAAFPWDSTSPGPGGFMNAVVEDGSGGIGGFWRENLDGTFTRITDYAGGGPSWLDLYMMGLADAREVPDMFILRNLRPVEGGGRPDTYTADREIISIEQVVAAEGPRVPGFAESQKDFNVGFVYLTEPGRRPDDYMLGLHATYISLIGEYWPHITGRRSRIVGVAARSGNRPPVAVGTLTDLGPAQK